MANDPAISPSRKRTAGAAGMNNSLSAAKRKATRVVRHTLHHKQQIAVDPAFVFQDHDTIRQMLDRSLATALEAVGFEYADPLALTSFRGLVEEYMAHFLRTVQRSMNAARRRTPVPHDFVQGLAAHNLTLTSLIPHLDPPVNDPTKQKHPILNSRSELQPHVEQADQEQGNMADSTDTSLLNIILNGRERDIRPEIIPAAFPALPSQHTYKAQAVFPARESDPQRIRELATEEGRQGEEALRRFTAKIAEIKANHDTVAVAAKRKDVSFIQKGQEMWKDLMDNLPAPPATNGASDPSRASETGDGRDMLSGPVNYESRYWRQPAKKTAEKT